MKRFFAFVLVLVVAIFVPLALRSARAAAPTVGPPSVTVVDAFTASATISPQINDTVLRWPGGMIIQYTMNSQYAPVTPRISDAAPVRWRSLLASPPNVRLPANAQPTLLRNRHTWHQLTHRHVNRPRRVQHRHSGASGA